MTFVITYIALKLPISIQVRLRYPFHGVVNILHDPAI